MVTSSTPVLSISGSHLFPFPVISDFYPDFRSPCTTGYFLHLTILGIAMKQWVEVANVKLQLYVSLAHAHTAIASSGGLLSFEELDAPPPLFFPSWISSSNPPPHAAKDHPEYDVWRCWEKTDVSAVPPVPGTLLLKIGSANPRVVHHQEFYWKCHRGSTQVPIPQVIHPPSDKKFAENWKKVFLREYACFLPRVDIPKY